MGDRLTGFIIWQAMYGSGSMIGMGIFITKSHPMPIQKDLTREQVKFYAVGTGTTRLITCGLRTALTINRMYLKIGRVFGALKTRTINWDLLFKDFFYCPFHINFFVAVFKNRFAQGHQ